MNPFLNFVDKIYCINLDSRKDRWERVTNQFKKVGIVDSVERVPAIEDEDPRKGCLESHLYCIQDASDKGYENVLIFEDDVCFVLYDDEDLAEAFNNIINDHRWDLFYLGGNVMYPAKFVHKHVFKSRFFSTHAYVINRRFFEKVKQSIVPIDKWYAWNTVSYGLYPMYATQDETYSDIRRKVIGNLEESFNRKYDLLVKPNIIFRWINYFRMHYLQKYLFHK